MIGSTGLCLLVFVVLACVFVRVLSKNAFVNTRNTVQIRAMVQQGMAKHLGSLCNKAETEPKLSTGRSQNTKLGPPSPPLC